jgi:hypothetical protein
LLDDWAGYSALIVVMDVAPTKPNSSRARRGTFYTVTALGLCLSVCHPARSMAQVYTAGTLQAWGGAGVTGIYVGADGSVGVDCQTFRINNGNALVKSISFPLWPYGARENPGLSQLLFQVGVVAWSGSRPSGSFLYLSSELTAPVANAFQTFTVNPPNLLLTQGQEYALVFTPQNYVAADLGSLSLLGYLERSAYSEGQMFRWDGLNPGVDALYTQDWQALPGNVAFSVNYQIVPVPEPQTGLLLCLAGACLWRTGRKQAGSAA